MGQEPLEQVFLRVLLLPSVNCHSTIPPHTHLTSPLAVCTSSDHAPYYHTLGPRLGTLRLTRHLAGLGVKVVRFTVMRTGRSGAVGDVRLLNCSTEGE